MEILISAVFSKELKYNDRRMEIKQKDKNKYKGE